MKALLNMSEIRSISLHPLAIHTFIKAQAGSLAKALSEAAMNSIDAFADMVEIKITHTGFEISDTGQGFQSRDEVAAWFETIGFPHDDQDHRLFGKFGMGRAQMWAFAKTVWFSNQFEMRVDVQTKGLDYELIEGGFHKGTKIVGTFYKPMDYAEVTRVQDELTRLLKYAPSLIIINGTSVSKNPALEQWDVETEEAYIRLNKQSTLDVYNSGVLVSHFPKYRYNCSGVVVTKPFKTLALNVARTDILESQCQVWKKISKVLASQKPTTVKSNNVRPSASELMSVGAEVAVGKKNLKDALQTHPHLICSVSGHRIAFFDLARTYYSIPVISAPKGDTTGKRLSTLKRAIVISQESLENFGFRKVSELKALVKRDLLHKGDMLINTPVEERFNAKVWSDEGTSYFKDFKEQKTVFVKSELSDVENILISAFSACSVAFKPFFKPSKFDICGFKVGDCPSRQAFISEAGEIVFRKKEFNAVLNKNITELQKYINVCFLEILSKDILKDETKASVYFMNQITNEVHLMKATLSLNMCYTERLRKNGLPVPKTSLADLKALIID